MAKNHKKVIFDASVLIAIIGKEKYSQELKKLIPKAIMSSVNVAEVARYLIEKKSVSKQQIKNIIEQLIEIITFDDNQAYVSAELTLITRKYGLSLGDRACLALALTTGYPVYTADKIWADISFTDITVKLIR
jgi:ribonuclease VapC